MNRDTSTWFLSSGQYFTSFLLLFLNIYWVLEREWGERNREKDKHGLLSNYWHNHWLILNVPWQGNQCATFAYREAALIMGAAWPGTASIFNQHLETLKHVNIVDNKRGEEVCRKASLSMGENSGDTCLSCDSYHTVTSQRRTLEIKWTRWHILSFHFYKRYKWKPHTTDILTDTDSSTVDYREKGGEEGWRDGRVKPQGTEETRLWTVSTDRVGRRHFTNCSPEVYIH